MKSSKQLPPLIDTNFISILIDPTRRVINTVFPSLVNVALSLFHISRLHHTHHTAVGLGCAGGRITAVLSGALSFRGFAFHDAGDGSIFVGGAYWGIVAFLNTADDLALSFGERCGEGEGREGCCEEEELHVAMKLYVWICLMLSCESNVRIRIRRGYFPSFISSSQTHLDDWRNRIQRQSYAVRASCLRHVGGPSRFTTRIVAVPSSRLQARMIDR